MILPCAAAAPAAPATRDWAGTLRGDAVAMHADIAANHPGPVNPLDPGFTGRNDAGLARALRRAAVVVDYPGYLAAMRGYAAAFDDGHLAISVAKEVPVAVRWPGFLTAFDEKGRQVVRAREQDAPVPLGAELIACDGRGATLLAKTVVGDFRGRWSLAATRGREGFRMLADNGNPFVRRPARCSFRVEGRTKNVALAWRPFSDTDWNRYAVPLAQPARLPISARMLADGTRWYVLSDFDGDLSAPTAKALTPMIAAMAQDRAAVMNAPRIVLDLRGNGGGSSDWSRQIAAVLWGEAAVDGFDHDPDRVDWRASKANVATLVDYRDTFAKAADASPAMRRYFSKAVDGIAAAHAAGRPLWREPDGLYAPDVSTLGKAAVPGPRIPIYFLTDWSCASACLDAADLWKALGAIQIGQETSADTLYMDVRQDVLPSGLLRLNVPMKVYRGRTRGPNVPLKPVHRYPGDMRDTAAIERWVGTLPEGRTR